MGEKIEKREPKTSEELRKASDWLIYEYWLGERWEKIKSRLKAGDASPVELPPYLEKGGILETSFYPNFDPDWYPGEQEYD